MDFYNEILKQFGPDDGYLKPDWDDFQSMPKALERAMIIYVLKRTKGNQVTASKHLGINRNTLRNRIQYLDIGSHPILENWRQTHGDTRFNPQSQKKS